jgi:hypothetical protein
MVAGVDEQAERAHARKVRLMARLTWPVVVAALMLVIGPAQLDGIARGVVLALMLGAVAALNVPSYEVIRRAQREGAPARLVRALVFTLALRLVAAVVSAALLW